MSKSPSLRRIQADVRELALDPSDRYHAAPLEDDMFEWHFTIRGADGTDFEGGVYHGRILLPPEYPFKPPHIVFLTPSGRFETGTKVCLSFSAYHPELWQPAWGIRLILEALISFLPTPADGAIGALDWTCGERKRLAKKSVSYVCPRCGKIVALLPEPTKDDGQEGSNKSKTRFQKEIEQLHLLQAAAEGKKDDNKDGDAKKEEEEKENGGGDAAAAEEKDEDAKEQVEEEEEEETKVDDKAVVAGSKEEEKAVAAEAAPPPQLVAEQPAVAAPPPPAGGRVAAPATEGVDTTTTAPPADETTSDLLDFSWLSDPVLHATIVILAIICFLLVRKFAALMGELRALNSGQYSP